MKWIALFVLVFVHISVHGQIVIHSGQTAIADVSIVDSTRIATNAVNAYKALGFIFKASDTLAARNRAIASFDTTKYFTNGVNLPFSVLYITKPNGKTDTLKQ